MYQEKMSFDTGIIVSCAHSKSYFKNINSKWGSDRYQLVISTKVEWESIKLLSRHPFYWIEGDAIKAVRRVIDDMILKREYKTEEDERAGKKLLEKYPTLNYPDNVIIAHFKRINVRIALTCDRVFKDVCNNEGIKGIYIPIAR